MKNYTKLPQSEQLKKSNSEMEKTGKINNL